MPVSTPKYKNLFCQTLKKQVLIRGFLLYSIAFSFFSHFFFFFISFNFFLTSHFSIDKLACRD